LPRLEWAGDPVAIGRVVWTVIPPAGRRVVAEPDREPASPTARSPRLPFADAFDRVPAVSWSTNEAAPAIHLAADQTVSPVRWLLSGLFATVFLVGVAWGRRLK
jgi:hypothetical protein